MKASGTQKGSFFTSRGLGWIKTLASGVRQKLFSFIAILSIVFAVGMAAIIYGLVKNYDQNLLVLYTNLKKERDFLELFVALRQAEYSVHDYFYYGDITDSEIWETAYSSIHQALNKLEIKEKEEFQPDDMILVTRSREDLKKWGEGVRSYFKETSRQKPAAANHFKNEEKFKVNHTYAEQLWQDFLEFHYKEQYDLHVLDDNLNKTRRELWLGLILSMAGFAFALGGMLYVLKKYFDRSSEHSRILEENEARYRAIVEDQTEYILRMKVDGTLLFVNEACCRFQNKKYEDQVGQRWQGLVTMDHGEAERISREIESINYNKQTVTVEFIMNDGMGIARWLQFVHRGIFDRDKKLIEIQSVGRDITPLKKAQQRLEAANALLESRVIERTRDLESALSNAREIQRSKENYLAIMSHEMRTPLQSISGFSEMLMDTNLTAEQRRYVETIASQNDMLLQLINDILDLSRLEANAVTLEISSINLHELVEQVVTFLQPLANSKNLGLNHFIHISSPAYIQGDPKRLRAVLTNLLGNAIKFTNSGSVSLAVKPSIASSDTREGSTTLITFEVRDTGIGIPQDRADDLFKMYSRIESGKSHVGGTGLGLAICKRCTDLMGGKIWVESTEGIGSTFYVEIPFTNAKPVAKEEKAPRQLPSTSIPTLSILVVEDNTIASTLLCDFLFKMGLWTDHCDNAKEAIHKICTRTYDLVFMDLNLPDISGAVAAMTIRSNKEIVNQPIIIGLSASAVMEDREKCMAAGMNDFLVKPIKQHELSALLQKWNGKNNAQGAPAEIDASALASYEELSRKSGKNTWQIISQTFLEETPSVLENIHSACKKKDVKQLRHFVHYLQGGADILGARAMSELCRMILDSVKTSVTGETQKLVGELEASSGKMLRSLRDKHL